MDDYTDAVSLDPSRFKENPDFENFIQTVISKHVYNSPLWIKRAQELKTGITRVMLIPLKFPLGWMNINDGRARYTRCIPSEDIFGSVLLADGVMVDKTYSPMPSHRLISEEGILFQLDSYLKTKALEEVKNFVSHSNE
eukprot:TRINITY_DN2867_c0_g1_i1.p1 TRINITY_DN2867_c0_g1~~TRINITY_DN2867_c0_g1_i1.p1  ORF type:complete len:139 (-),score=20.62 TRINITY_DN2867_c0_g1_i1:76-492(-)